MSASTQQASVVAVRVVDLECRLGGRPVVAGVGLDVRYGEVLALVGPNGAGKSTVLGAVAGDLAASAGSVLLDDRDVGEWSTRDLARRRSVLLQSHEVSFAFTVREVVEMGRAPWLGREEQDDDEEAVAEAMRRADVVHLADRPFTQLSGGERARAALARVLAQRTDVVLLDEPTAALDLRHTEDVMAVARDLAAAGRAVVVVLHDLSLAAAHADVIAVLDAGRLVAHGAPADVLTPEVVSSTYGIDVHVIADPDGRLLVVPRRAPRPHPDTPSRPI
ncbi:hemin ABC transporter ATP-binding protein [Aeromicrobium sp. Root495]|uniref:heme ABC transporter ATP-binding protein n=1 Tax=Aeromicrobium sp. Root495 TaxID=1736550 RepID=UPI0006FF1B49|nr:heme ABC transporter ATP-binding protein [Aeromicrobium sp. Root495]KQY59981.1 hemin ABC transporter ATP-binding protein [Aeromicrobium sp. Root495]